MQINTFTIYAAANHAVEASYIISKFLLQYCVVQENDVEDRHVFVEESISHALFVRTCNIGNWLIQ